MASDVADIVPNSNGTADEVEKTKRTIYLHLKKFFRGARFTCMPFLRSIQGKHKEGDVVCVSGKVDKYTIFEIEHLLCYSKLLESNPFLW